MVCATALLMVLTEDAETRPFIKTPEQSVPLTFQEENKMVEKEV